MATGRRRSSGASRRAQSESVVVPFPDRGAGVGLELARLLPSGSSLLVAFALLVGAVGAYLVARNTALFGVRAVVVEGAPQGVARQVERTLADEHGRSLLAVDVGKLQAELEALPWVARVEIDRAFPHALRIAVTPERPVAVARQGSRSYLVSGAGRVVASVDRGARPSLARVWVRRDVKLVPGQLVMGDPLSAVRAVAPLAGSRFPSRVTSVTVGEESVTLRLRSGVELRLGEPTDLDLKLAVAASVLPLLRVGSTYLDVSVPDRPVGGVDTGTPEVTQEQTQPQVESETQLSTNP